MKECLVSCIVPVYNVEKYLNQCIESIVGQTYKNIEILLINDGSTDSSLEVCKNWEKVDERIKVVNRENGGLSSARNIGLNIMTGEWVVFIDSDDYVHPQYISLLLNAVKDQNKLISCCDYKKFTSTNMDIGIDEYKVETTEVINNINNNSNFYEKVEALGYAPWNKLYHRSLFQEFRFYKGKIHEDVGLLFYLIGIVKEFVKVPYELYYYRDNPKGIINSNKGMKKMDLIDVTLQQYEYFVKIEDKAYANLILKVCIDFFPGLYYELNENKQFNKKVFMEKYKSIYIILKDIKEIDRRTKWKHKMYILFPCLIPVLRKYF